MSKEIEIVKYQSLLGEIKTAIKQARLRATLAVNAEMILLYWQTGRMITERQLQEGWSAKVIPRLAADLRQEFADLKGFSERNLGYMLRFALEYPQIPILQQPVAKTQNNENEANIILQQPTAKFTGESILPQLVANLPWGHNILLMEKVKDKAVRFWYMQQTVDSGAC